MDDGKNKKHVLFIEVKIDNDGPFDIFKAIFDKFRGRVPSPVNIVRTPLQSITDVPDLRKDPLLLISIGDKRTNKLRKKRLKEALNKHKDVTKVTLTPPKICNITIM